MNLATLKNIIKNAPDVPGIYHFQNERREDIYIGKASSIKKRLASYIKTADPRIRTMVDSASDLKYIETESDIEALILESQLIKQKRPQFNIMLRDDKQYFYVCFTDDEFSKVVLTHQIGNWKMKNGNFVGPFTDGAAIKATLKYLRNIFPYCTCTQKHHNFCLNYHIGKCPGICCIKDPELRISDYELQKQKYFQNIKAIRNILDGRRSTLVKELRSEMAQAGKDHDFPKAIELKSKLERLEQVFYNAQVIKNSEILQAFNSGLQKLLKSKHPIIRIEGYDISNIQGKHATGSMVTFVNGVPEKRFYRKFAIRNSQLINSSGNDTAMLREILERRFSHPEWPFPDLILIDGGKGQLNVALATLRELGITNYELRIIALSKNDQHKGHQIFIPSKKIPIPLSKLTESDRNVLLAVDAEAHRFAINYYRKLHRKSL